MIDRPILRCECCGEEIDPPGFHVRSVSDKDGYPLPVQCGPVSYYRTAPSYTDEDVTRLVEVIKREASHLREAAADIEMVTRPFEGGGSVTKQGRLDEGGET
jgi:hypothetical protein